MRVPSSQQGFTLIELIVVIVILGILAATALPKFIDVSVDAADAAAAATAGAISSGSVMNYAQFKAQGTAILPITSGTSTCDNLKGLLQSGALPDKITWIDSAAVITCTGGAGGISNACQLKHDKGTAAGTTNTVVTTICTVSAAS